MATVQTILTIGILVLFTLSVLFHHIERRDLNKDIRELNREVAEYEWANRYCTPYYEAKPIQISKTGEVMWGFKVVRVPTQRNGEPNFKYECVIKRFIDDDLEYCKREAEELAAILNEK